MISHDMHIHTEYCGHAPGMTVQAICRQAEKLGLETIAIADHVYRDNGVEVVDKIRTEAATIKTNCRVIIGAEIDVDGASLDGELVTDRLDGIDYVVAGFHYVPGQGNYPWSPDDCKLDGEEFFKRWRRALLGVVSEPKIHTLAHPARLLAASVDLDVFFEDALTVFAEAAKISARNNIAWEINELTGSRISKYWQSRWHEIYKIALNAGVKLVYGSDAHDLSAIGRCEFAEQVLKKLPGDSLTGPRPLQRP